eukprot:jgi/Tetstr1/423307/TSEL_014005.t1
MGDAGGVEAALRGWVQAAGGYVSPAVSLMAEQGGGERGVRAVSAIRAGQQLCVIPQRLCIFMPPPGSDPCTTGASSFIPDTEGDLIAAGSYLRAAATGLNPFLATTLLLMHEAGKGASAPRQPYLATLPEEVGNLASWSAAERRALAGTSIAAADVALQGIFEEDVSPLLAGGGDLWPPTQRTFEAFRHAYGLVQSRGFRMQQENWVTGEVSQGDELYLLCAIDMLNHSSRPERINTELAKIDDTMSIDLPSGERAEFTGFFGVTAARDIREGEELLLSYGPLGDSELLRMYGFVEQHPDGFANPHSKVLITYNELLVACRTSVSEVGADEAMEEKEQLLAEIGLTGPVFTLGMPPDGSAAARLPDDMVTAMIVLHMPEEHFQDAKTELAAPALPGSGPVRLGEDYFQYMEEEAFRAMMGMLIRLFDTHIRELDRQGRLLILHSVAATTCCRCLAPSAAPSAGLPEEPAGAPGDMPYREKCARHVAQTERALFVLFKKAVLQHLVLWQGASDSEAGSSDEEERVSESCEEEDAEGGEGEGRA